MHENERHKDNRTPPFPITFPPSQAPAPIPITTKEKPIEQVKPVPIAPIMVPIEPHPEPQIHQPAAVPVARRAANAVRPGDGERVEEVEVAEAAHVRVLRRNGLREVAVRQLVRDLEGRDLRLRAERRVGLRRRRRHVVLLGPQIWVQREAGLLLLLLLPVPQLRGDACVGLEAHQRLLLNLVWLRRRLLWRWRGPHAAVELVADAAKGAAVAFVIAEEVAEIHVEARDGPAVRLEVVGLVSGHFGV